MRFGDNCYDELDTSLQSIEDNANQCADKLGFLWYPENYYEFKFVREKFPVSNNGEVYHLGIHVVYNDGGFWLLDGTENPGIPFYTCKY